MTLPDRLQRPDPDSTAIVVIDVQERILAAMDSALRSQMLDNLERLGAAGRELGIPAIVTEQYKKGLGPTPPKVADAFGNVDPLEKLTFDAFEDEAICAALDARAPETVIVTGIETHVCVFQSVRSLVDRGHRVLLLADGVASRTRSNYEIGLRLAKDAGAALTSTEAVLFDLLRRAGSDAFRAISKLVR